MSGTDDIAVLPYVAAARVHCLRLAIEMRTGSTSTDQLVAWAKAFEAYVLDGIRPEPSAEPKVSGAPKGRSAGHANR